jgi:hypothetical protein
VRSHHPAKHDYTIERNIPNPPVVKNEAGDLLSLTPRTVVPDVEVFGQHEISELTKRPEKLTLLLERFVERDLSAAGQKTDLRMQLERSRPGIVDTQLQINSINDRLSLLPGLEETQKRYKQTGLEERLKEKGQLVHEEQILAMLIERLSPVATTHQNLLKLLPVDIAFLSAEALQGLPNASILTEGQTILERLTDAIQDAASRLAMALDTARTGITGLRAKWDIARQPLEDNYQRILRELQKDKIDGEEFINLSRDIQQLRLLAENRETFARDLATNQAARRKLLDEWANLQAAEYRHLERAARKVSKKLEGRVRATVTMAGNREPLEKLLRDEVGGNLSTLLDRIRNRTNLSLLDLAARCREGKEALVTHLGFPPAAAERLAQADPTLFMKIEELDLPATTKIELNTAANDAPPTWKTLDALSTGQKATAVLLLLLLESDAPLIVDQPEDDLDNSFIADGVVPTMKHEKRKRQFIFSTHNANIPVLGDAELIIGLSTAVQNYTVQGHVSQDHMGSIDIEPVREMVEDNP